MTVRIRSLGVSSEISWDRQDRRNAWDLETMSGIADRIEAAGADEEVRCIVLRGVGEHFSAGDDLKDAVEASAGDWRATIAGFQRMTHVVLNAPVPVIAAIDGACIGGALELAASCDFRIGTDRSFYGTPEVTIGLVATNAGTLFLPEVLGEGAARELLLTGVLRDSDWAFARGFLNAVVEPEQLIERAKEWSEAFENTSRAAVARTKSMLNQRHGSLLGEAMERETRACVELFDGPDAPAALRRFASRRR